MPLEIAEKVSRLPLATVLCTIQREAKDKSNENLYLYFTRKPKTNHPKNLEILKQI